MSRNRTTRTTQRAQAKKWTREEDAMLLRQVRAFPQNLHKCFLIVSEQTGRTDKAVAAHWYQAVSKRDDALCFFTASEHHVSKNRKNGMGEESRPSIWKRLLRVLGLSN